MLLKNLLMARKFALSNLGTFELSKQLLIHFLKPKQQMQTTRNG